MGAHDKHEIINKIKSVTPLLKKMQYPAKRVGLFGSVARGDDTIESDIDILIDFGSEDDSAIVRGFIDAKKILRPVIGMNLHLTDYPLPSGDPPELIWVETDIDI